MFGYGWETLIGIQYGSERAESIEMGPSCGMIKSISGKFSVKVKNNILKDNNSSMSPIYRKVSVWKMNKLKKEQ